MQVHEPVQAPAHPLMTPVFPRFTAQEVLILNLIVNAYPGHISIREILRHLDQTMAYSEATPLSIKVAVCSIRAKLGEKKWKPSRLIAIFDLSETGRRGRMIGYAWRG